MSDTPPTTEALLDATDTDFIAWLSRSVHRVGIYVAMPALIGLIGIDVFLRYGFRAPLPWGNEVGSLLLLIVFLASLPHCTQLGDHVRMDLLYGHYGPRAKRWADAVSALCGLAFAAPLAYQAFVVSARMYRLGDGAYLVKIPYWPFAALLGLSASFVCLQFGISIARALRPIRRQVGD